MCSGARFHIVQTDENRCRAIIDFALPTELHPEQSGCQDSNLRHKSCSEVSDTCNTVCVNTLTQNVSTCQYQFGIFTCKISASII